MRYLVKIHISTGLIQGYLDEKSLNKLKSAYKNKSDEVCNVSLTEIGSLNSNDIDVSILPSQIIAIESKFVR